MESLLKSSLASIGSILVELMDVEPNKRTPRMNEVIALLSEAEEKLEFDLEDCKSENCLAD